MAFRSFGEAFRQILHARLGQELAGIGPVAGRGVEIAGVAGTVKVSSIWASLDGKAGLWGCRGT